VALSYEAKRQGDFSRLDALNMPGRQALRDYLRGPDFPVLVARQVFTNQDGSSGILYLACSDLDGDAEGLIAIYRQTVERGDLSQDAQEPCGACQVIHENGTDAEQPLFPGDLMLCVV